MYYIWTDESDATGFYNYLDNPDNFTNPAAMTGDAYEDMRCVLEANNVFTGWQPQHRIQFAHSKGDMIVPYGNYMAFSLAYPDDEGDTYRIDNTFSNSDHLNAGTAFIMKLGTDFFDYFEWIDDGKPTGIVQVESGKWKEEGGRWKEDSWYDLQGRKLPGKPTAKGVYISSGRKVLVP